MTNRRGVPNHSNQSSKATTLPEFPLAACRGKPVELFIPSFDDDSLGRPRFDPEPAKRICWRCPEREDCLAYALDNPSLMGVWGATTQAERKQMSDERNGIVARPPERRERPERVPCRREDCGKGVRASANPAFHERLGYCSHGCMRMSYLPRAKDVP